MKIVITKQRKQEGEEVDDDEEDKVILVSWFDSLTPHLLQKRNQVFVLRLLFFFVSVEKNFSPEVLQIILKEPYAGSDRTFFMEIFGYGYINVLEQLIT